MKIQWLGEKKVQPNTLGDVQLSAGGSLLGIALLVLAGYGIYKLVK